ncbi:integrator complex subunit 5-like isoform X1 [Watersipora subatra]|uniref:integrator complex subunit 5-like isoform X1 n=1 Tax=Watersipora subatra TaxID=2589382 RepID=UPI00355BC47B
MASGSGTDVAALHSAVKCFTSQLNPMLYKGEQSAKGVTAAALSLLRQLPVARNAVLSYFGRRFDEAANRYLQHRVDKITGNIYNNPGYNEQAAYESLAPISTGFSDLIVDPSWAPQLSKWAIDLLGHISKKLNSTNAAPLTTSTNTVEEKLELWMACSATKILIEITSNCFSVLVNTSVSVDGCVESLLDASIRYSPHFDWVVAHLGSCFPKTIIDRVLVAGYKEFISPNSQGSSKFSSAAAILGYLSAQHKTTARRCIVEYLQNVLDQPPPGAATAVTFLLNTASLSATIVPVITSDISAIFNTHTLNKLTAHYIVGTHDFPSLMHIAVHLLLRLDQSALSVINAIFDLATASIISECNHQPLRQEVRTAAQQILGKLSNEIYKVTVCSRINNKVKTDLPTLKYLILNNKALIRRLNCNKANLGEAKLACRLLLACGWQGGVTTAIDILYEFLIMDRPWVVGTLQEFLQHFCIRYPDMEEGLCRKVFISCQVEMVAVRNLLAYVNTKTETSEKVARCVLRYHMRDLSALINCKDTEDHFACLSFFSELLLMFPGGHFGHMPSCEVLLTWYYKCLKCGYDKQANSLVDYLVQSCSQSVSVLSTTLRTIITVSLDKVLPPSTADVADVSLSSINSQMLGGLHLPPTQTYILHNEHIGSGKKKLLEAPTQEAKFLDRQHVVLLVIRCCEVKASTYNSTDAKELLSRLLLELVTPDVIAAQAQWHEPITHERELAIRRQLDDHPFLWDLLGYICSYKPCFVTASLLIRCYLASLSTSWSKVLDSSARSMPREMEATERVMAFLVKADLLPRPLVYISELFPHIAAYEMKLLLEIVCRCLQSSLQKGLSRDSLDDDDLKTIQSIVQQNISELCEVSLKFFVVE